MIEPLAQKVLDFGKRDIEFASRMQEPGKDVIESLRGRVGINAPRRPAGIAAALAGMGVGRDLYAGIMSSGEAVYLGLRDRTDEFSGLGTQIYHLGPPRDRDVFDALPYEEVLDPAVADFILNTGPDDILGPQDPELYRPVLDAGLKARIPMI